CPTSDETYNLVLNAMDLMDSELMPSGARAAMLRVLATAAATQRPNEAFFNLGDVADRAGHQAVAIAFEYQDTPSPSFCPGGTKSATFSTKPGKGSVPCSLSASASTGGTVKGSGSNGGTSTASGGASTQSISASRVSDDPSPSASSAGSSGGSGSS